MTPTTVRTVAFGRPATEALAEAIAGAKHAHPLDPVTVVVPSNLAALSARRTIAGGLLGGTGLANVSFVTAFRLAELLGAGHVGGRRPLTNPVLAAAVRAALKSEPGVFAAVADHHATHAALVSVYGELSHVGPASLDRIAAASVRGREVVRLVRSVKARLAAFYYDEDDLAAAAEARMLTEPAGIVESGLGRVVWHLPGRLTPALARLLRAVIGAGPATVIVGLTGHGDADAAAFQACAAAAVLLPVPAVATLFSDPSPPTASVIVSVSDADEEVRTVVRRVLVLAEAGTPLHRIGIFHPGRDPYGRNLNEQLDAAGVPHNGPSRTPLADTVAGRTLLRALALNAESDGWGRGAVMALISGAPVRHASAGAAVSRWDAVSRAAGVVAGLDDWRTRLADLVSRLQADLDELERRGETSLGRLAAIRRDADAAVELSAFVEHLAGELDALQHAPGWAARTQAARALLAGLLGPEQRRTRWPASETDAADRVDAALSRLASLDEVESDPSPEAFVAAVASELDEPAGRVGRFGEGVLHGPLASAVGLDLDAVFVLGMAEGTCPCVGRPPALLPEEDRQLAGADELARAEDRLADQHRDFLAALAAGADPTHRVLVYPRGDLRAGRTRLASRWLLESAAALAGHPVRSSQFADLGAPVVEVVASFARGMADSAVKASVNERDLAALFAHVEAGGDVATHPIAIGDGDVAVGLTCRRARSGARFTEWDGNLAGQPVASPATGEVMSASRLQKWASCPFAYFLSYVLDLSDRDDPERIIQISAMDKGSLVHEVLERFIAAALARPGGPPAPSEAWTPADLDRLHTVAAEVFATYEARGVTGRRLTWRITQQEVLADLDELLRRDTAYRAARGVVPVAVEMPFGMDGAAPLVVQLPSGRELRFRGKVDRVDAGAGHHVVLDYKTGKGVKYKKLEGEGDAVLAGTALQLGLYAEAVRARLGGGDMEAYYWLATSDGGFARRGYPWTGERRERFLQVLETIVDGVEAGTFPGVPGQYDSFFRSHDNCSHCAFDDLCPRDRDDHAEAKVAAPELAVLARLLPPEPPDPDPGATTAPGSAPA